jgi:hypothetical protein
MPSVRVFPNPAHRQLTIQFESDLSGSTTADVLDINGRLIQKSATIETVQSRLKVDVEDLETGLYIIRLYRNGQSTTKKFYMLIGNFA